LKLDALKQKVENALKKLSTNDSFLIDANTNERTISHKLAEYLQEEFPNLYWNVDCEYNRHGGEIKRLEIPQNKNSLDDIEAKTVFPDIIIHQRNNDDNNLLLIEVKKSSNTQSRRLDENKLIAFTKEPYNYRFGLFLEISMDNTTDFLQWYSRGKKFYEEKVTVETN